MQIISLLLVVSLIFLPIYTCAYVPSSADELGNIQNFEEFEKLMENGTIDKNFSLWEDFRIVITNLLSEGGNGLINYMSFVFGMFAIFEIIFAIVLVCTTIVQIIKSINEINGIDRTTLLTFSQIKKSGTAQKKENFFKKQTAITIVFYALFDVIYSKLGNMLFEITPGNMKPEMAVERYMISFKGFSAFVSVVIILFIGYFILKGLIKKREENLVIAIAEEDIETIE